MWITDLLRADKIPGKSAAAAPGSSGLAQPGTP